MRKILTVLAILTILLVQSCDKAEGIGGTASIEGRVMKVLHPDDNFSLQSDTIVAAKEDVFIAYGDSSLDGDDLETNAQGQFIFSYLNPGTYTIYAYSELPTGQRVAEKRIVTLSRGQHAKLNDIFIHTGKAYRTSMIKGWVRATYFDKNGSTVRTSWAYDQRVYVKRTNDDYYIDDTRVGIDGTFYFQKLQPGSYVVFTFGQNQDETPAPVTDTIAVAEPEIIYIADTLNIRLKA